ncbi:rRNA maturation RNase YbeY [bacterium]|jgi:probable rRNA maturation factor|nr:rRNA maturation RNase YbeY [bacterium]
MTQNPIQIQVNTPYPMIVSYDVKAFILRMLTLKNIASGEFEFTFTDNATITEIHAKHMNLPTPTDIITFNLGTPQAIEGDIYISVEQATLNADTYNNTLDQEIKLLITHGILHLLDYRDYTDTERTQMEAEQDRLLALEAKIL